MGIRWDGKKFVDDIPGGLLNLDGAEFVAHPEHDEIARLADLRKRLDALEAPALIDKLEREGRICAADRADVTDDVKAFGLERAAARWSRRQAMPAGTSPDYRRWKAKVEETATKLRISQVEACAHVSRADPALTRLAFADHP